MSDFFFLIWRCTHTDTLRDGKRKWGSEVFGRGDSHNEIVSKKLVVAMMGIFQNGSE